MPEKEANRKQLPFQGGHAAANLGEAAMSMSVAPVQVEPSRAAGAQQVKQLAAAGQGRPGQGRGSCLHMLGRKSHGPRTRRRHECSPVHFIPRPSRPPPFTAGRELLLSRDTSSQQLPRDLRAGQRRGHDKDNVLFVE